MPEIRPTFELETSRTVPEVMAALRASMNHPDAPASGCTASRHAELYVPESARRAWSPWLSLELDATPVGCRVHGRFSPHPHLWTLYMFLWFALGFATLVGATWGYAQWATDATPWALALIPVAAVGAAGLVIASLVGQRLGTDQMIDLRAVVYAAVSQSAAGPRAGDLTMPDAP